MQRIKLAIQNKGRLGKEVLPLLAHAGIRFDLRERELYARATNFALDLLLVRHADIGSFVAEGAADIGIVGSDVLAENAVEAEEVMRLGLARAQLCLMVGDQSPFMRVQDLSGQKVATHFPNLVSRYFRELGVDIKIVTMRGSVEIAPKVKIAAAVADLVGSGATMKENDLRELSQIMVSEGVLIKRKAMNAELVALLEELQFRLESVLAARGRKLLIFHLPKARLEALMRFHLGLSGPTVAEVQNGGPGLCSVQLVVEEDKSWGITRELRQIGASGILVMDIERIIN